MKLVPLTAGDIVYLLKKKKKTHTKSNKNVNSAYYFTIDY